MDLEEKAKLLLTRFSELAQVKGRNWTRNNSLTISTDGLGLKKAELENIVILVSGTGIKLSLGTGLSKDSTDYVSVSITPGNIPEWMFFGDLPPSVLIATDDLKALLRAATGDGVTANDREIVRQFARKYLS